MPEGIRNYLESERCQNPPGMIPKWAVPYGAPSGIYDWKFKPKKNILGILVSKDNGCTAEDLECSHKLQRPEGAVSLILGTLLQAEFWAGASVYRQQILHIGVGLQLVMAPI